MMAPVNSRPPSLNRERREIGMGWDKDELAKSYTVARIIKPIATTLAPRTSRTQVL